MIKKKKEKTDEEEIEEDLEPEVEDKVTTKKEYYDEMPVPGSNLIVFAQSNDFIILKDKTYGSIYSVERSIRDGMAFLKPLKVSEFYRLTHGTKRNKRKTGS